MDDEVIVGTGWIAGEAFVRFEWTVRNGEMVGVDMLFSFEIECRHDGIPLGDLGVYSLFPSLFRSTGNPAACIS